MRLWGGLVEHGYTAKGGLTCRQVRDAGGCVRKGEHGVTVVYADRFTPEAEKARARERGEDARSVPFLKRFTVFNLAQCEGRSEEHTSELQSLMRISYDVFSLKKKKLRNTNISSQYLNILQ